MRTTLTLEDDVAAKLKSEARRTGHSFKQVVNDLLRQALLREKPPARKKFKVIPTRMRPKEGIDYDCIGELMYPADGIFRR